jgi:predicted phosphate transport protein (TIGR00153 family)
LLTQLEAEVFIMVLDSKRFLNQELANVTQMIEEHFRIAHSANRIVANAIAEWLGGGTRVSEEDLKKITDLEEKGDEIKRAILNELAKANSLMQREDLLRLVHYNDKLIDGAEIACYHLAALSENWHPSGELKERLMKMGELVLSIVATQREAVRFLSINHETSLKHADEICRIEKKIDIVQRGVLTQIYSSGAEIANVLRCSDFVNTLEEISNLSEDAALTIRGLSLTLNT